MLAAGERSHQGANVRVRASAEIGDLGPAAKFGRILIYWQLERVSEGTSLPVSRPSMAGQVPFFHWTLYLLGLSGCS